ncbi:hypothetical protein [Paracholeplasma manati]|jgi:hypothetical protein|uniref:Uncharacterized protein n=1 Tax=Paracholeplasma manati TaxID=591373 RepID=A0ABT2Y6V5_9MOLU|nr:hypothetical protein [Paracholeplasma manati]MCV2232476.1 hypothetical protein [Paracholeplasma manati]MDG0888728.1 hypothetical protein [Paracholeplasma manati]MDX9808022.1 hypothetical protein [Acholeplasma sp.]
MRWILWTEFRRLIRPILGIFLIILSLLLILALRGKPDIFLLLNDLINTSFLFFPVIIFAKLMHDFYGPKFKLYQSSSIQPTAVLYANLVLWIMVFTVYFIMMVGSINLLFTATDVPPLWSEGYGYKVLLMIGKRSSDWWGIFQSYFHSIYLIILSIILAYWIKSSEKKLWMIYAEVVGMYLVHAFIRWIVISINNRFIFMNYNRVNSYYPIMYLDNEINHMSLFGIIIPIIYLSGLMVFTVWRLRHEN